MRLSQTEVSVIKSVIEKFVSSYSLFLHGSRISDELKGGDIDLFLVVPHQDLEQLKMKKHYLLAELSLMMNDQRVDLTLLSNQEENSDEFFLRSDKINL